MTRRQMGNGIVVNASDYIVKCNIKENFFQTKIAQMKGVIEGGENQGIDVTKKLWVAWRGRVVAVKKIYFNML